VCDCGISMLVKIIKNVFVVNCIVFQASEVTCCMYNNAAESW